MDLNSARLEPKNINNKNAKCITTSTELKTFPNISLLEISCIKVLVAVITGASTRPRAKAKPAAVRKCAEYFKIKAKAANIRPPDKSEEYMLLKQLSLLPNLP